MELNGNVYKASVKSTQSDNYTACLCCLHAETNVLSEYTMKTYTRLHCFSIEEINTRLSLKQVTQNKKFQALQSLRRVSNAWNSLLKNVIKIESN